MVHFRILEKREQATVVVDGSGFDARWPAPALVSPVSRVRVSFRCRGKGTGEVSFRNVLVDEVLKKQGLASQVFYGARDDLLSANQADTTKY
jgi:hypothetical protein